MKGRMGIALLMPWALCFSREVISTDCSSSTIRYTSTHPDPHFLAIEYPRSVVPHLISMPVYKVVEEEGSTIVILRLGGRRVLDIFCEKDLCRAWECSPYIDEGVVIKAVGVVGGKAVWTDQVVDWVVIPDFTVQFVAFNTFGMVLTLVMKVYCSPGNVFGRPRRGPKQDD